MECRITAEDPCNDSLPATGVVRYLRPPAGPGVRWDGGVEAGNEVTLFYDPLIAKLIAWGETREGALQRMRRGLQRDPPRLAPPHQLSGRSGEHTSGLQSPSELLCRLLP